ncbi:hypothetical protein Zmor_001102 [Zophobas morio]|uniref:Uncharacterized protein n=1 Tax=Zophobas morio TaxID=2755281 RepID=A0AA38IXT7_9CUCU|nr:hypothetical protein Zmor_001102 [Zophobas morio]
MYKINLTGMDLSRPYFSHCLDITRPAPDGGSHLKSLAVLLETPRPLLDLSGAPITTSASRLFSERRHRQLTIISVRTRTHKRRTGAAYGFLS